MVQQEEIALSENGLQTDLPSREMVLDPDAGRWAYLADVGLSPLTMMQRLPQILTVPSNGVNDRQFHSPIYSLANCDHT